jgi:hypothetical protein
MYKKIISLIGYHFLIFSANYLIFLSAHHLSKTIIAPTSGVPHLFGGRHASKSSGIIHHLTSFLIGATLTLSD